MWSKLFYSILFVIFSIFHQIQSTEVDNCCRYGFEDGVKLNMLRENKKWALARSQNFAHCEILPFGRDAFRKCKTIGEEMAFYCYIGKYYALMGFECDTFRDDNPTVYTCCSTCSNGRMFAEKQFDLFDNATNEFGEEIYKNRTLYSTLLSQVDLDIEEQCKKLNLVHITPELQLSTFNQCCRSWTYNYNQNFYQDHFSVNDTCNRINICLDRQNHTRYNLDQITDPRDLTRMKTENVMKIVNKQMAHERQWIDKSFEEILLRGPEPDVHIVPLPAKRKSPEEFHSNRLRSVEEEKKFHPNISDYELSVRRVPADKFKYHYCNRVCKDSGPVDYTESTNEATGQKKEVRQCFQTLGQQFCSRPIECRIGYFPNRNNTLCVELNECAEKLHDCLDENEFCVNHFDGYSCECKVGFRFDLITKKCININECAEKQDACPPNSYCIDHDGWYECRCYEGLFKNEFGQCLQVPSGRIQNSEKVKTNTDESNDGIFFSLNPTMKSKEEPPSSSENPTGIAKEEIPSMLCDSLAETNESERRRIEAAMLLTESNVFTNSAKVSSSTTEPQTEITSTENSVQSKQIVPSVPIEKSETVEKSEPIEKSDPTKKSEPTMALSPKIETTTTESSVQSTSDKNSESSVILSETPETKAPIASSVQSHPNERRELPIEVSVDTTIDYGKCQSGYQYVEGRPAKCVDINEFADPKLNNCQANQTCINLEGTYHCNSETKPQCPKDYINVNLYTNEHHRASTYVFLLILFCFIIFIGIVFVFTYFVYRRFSYNYEIISP